MLNQCHENLGFKQRRTQSMPTSARRNNNFIALFLEHFSITGVVHGCVDKWRQKTLMAVKR